MYKRQAGNRRADQRADLVRLLGGSRLAGADVYKRQSLDLQGLFISTQSEASASAAGRFSIRKHSGREPPFFAHRSAGGQAGKCLSLIHICAVLPISAKSTASADAVLFADIGKTAQMCIRDRHFPA